MAKGSETGCIPRAGVQGICREKLIAGVCLVDGLGVCMYVVGGRLLFGGGLGNDYVCG